MSRAGPKIFFLKTGRAGRAWELPGRAGPRNFGPCRPLTSTTGARAHNYNDAIKYKFIPRVVQKVTPLVVATYSNIEGKFQQKFQLLCLSKVTDGQIILSLLTDTSVVK